MNMSKNNYAFIDSQNLNFAIKDQGWKLDFRRFRKYLSDKYGVAKAFLFIGYVPTQQSLYTSLQEYGYIVVFKPTGDGDFHCLIDHLKKQNKLEKLIVPNRYKFSSLLRKFAPDMAFMNDLRGKLEYK